MDKIKKDSVKKGAVKKAATRGKTKIDDTFECGCCSPVDTVDDCGCTVDGCGCVDTCICC